VKRSVNRTAIASQQDGDGEVSVEEGVEGQRRQNKLEGGFKTLKKREGNRMTMAGKRCRRRKERGEPYGDGKTDWRWLCKVYKKKQRKRKTV
jgi:hypothetical protein